MKPSYAGSSRPTPCPSRSDRLGDLVATWVGRERQGDRIRGQATAAVLVESVEAEMGYVDHLGSAIESKIDTGPRDSRASVVRDRAE